MTNTDPPSWDPGSGQPVPSGQPMPPPASPYPPPAGQGPPPAGPPSPYGGPGQPLGAPEPHKKRKVWPWVVGVLAILFLGIGGCTFALVQATSGPIDQANEFLGALADNDRPAAAAMLSTSSQCFGENAAADLDTAVGNDQITGYDLSGSSVSTSNGMTTGEAAGTIDINEDQGIPIRFLLTKEGEDWKVCGFSIDG